MAMPPDMVPLSTAAAGVYTGQGAFTMAGRWNVSVLAGSAGQERLLGSRQMKVSN
jgi:hypothetical protein